MAFVDVVVVDPSLRHLEREFTYRADDELAPGRLVRVAFHGRLRNAVVVGPAEPFADARPIKTVVGPGLPAAMMPLARELAAATLTDEASVIAAMLPERVASEEAKVPDAPGPLGPSPGPAPDGLLRALAPPGRILFAPGVATDFAGDLARLVHEELAEGGRVLVVLPEADREATVATRLMEAAGEQGAWLGSDVSPRLRYRAWLRVRHGLCRLAIGGRAAIFAPMEPTLVIIVDEASAAHKEGRAPRIHVPAVAKLVAGRAGARLVLVGTPPSLASRLDADPRRKDLVLHATPNGIRSDVRILDPAGLSPAPVTMRLLADETARIAVLVHRSDQLAATAERLGRHLERSVTVLDASSEAAVRKEARRLDGPAIVVGTSVLAEDHPIAGVGTLAILGVDAALASPGFRAAEEVAATWWRAVNATRPRRILVESRDRAHHAIEALSKLDHDRFTRAEADVRHAIGYPPYRTLVRFSLPASGVPRVLEDLEGRSLLGPMTDPTDEELSVIAVRGDRRLVADLAPLVQAWRRDGIRVRSDVDPWDLVEERWRS